MELNKIIIDALNSYVRTHELSENDALMVKKYITSKEIANTFEDEVYKKIITKWLEYCEEIGSYLTSMFAKNPDDLSVAIFVCMIDKQLDGSVYPTYKDHFYATYKDEIKYYFLDSDDIDEQNRKDSVFDRLFNELEQTLIMN